MIQLPEGFILRMRDQLGEEAEAFFSALENVSPTSIRLHHTKGKSSFAISGEVPWCSEGVYLNERPAFFLDPHWHGGAYYVQEASSMILDHVIRQIPFSHAPKIWIDMCAAPGGKTGILTKHIQPADVLLANEVIGTRRSVLRENLTKAGYLNTFISGEPVSSFRDPFADVILIDAPCAGEGMMRKETEAVHQWNQNLVDSCSVLQKQIVQDAAQCLKPGGYLIYSTCSYSMEENIHNVQYFQEHFQLDSVSIDFDPDWGIQPIQKGTSIGFQLYPHKLSGEGLFIALLKNNHAPHASYGKPKKPFRIFEPLPAWLEAHVASPESLAVKKQSAENEMINIAAIDKANELLMHIPKASAIVAAGEMKGRDFVPSHSLATSGLASDQFGIIPVDLSTAQDFLERNASTLPPADQKAWYLIQFSGTTLGWAKWTGQGWKNHFPMGWRLRDRGKK